MKILPVIIILSSCLLLGCKNEPVVTAVKSELEESNLEAPKKKISEQYSSPDNLNADTKVVTADISEELKSTAVEAKQEPKTNAPKPAISKSTTPKEEEATYVKTISKPKKSKAKRRAAEIEFDEYLYDFGEIVEGDKIDYKFTFKNTGNAPLTITEADATCGCATPSIPFIDILPGEVGYIGVNYNSVGKEGEQTPQVTIYSNAQKHPILVLKLKGYVMTKEEAKEEKAKLDTIISEVKDTIKEEIPKQF